MPETRSSARSRLVRRREWAALIIGHWWRRRRWCNLDDHDPITLTRCGDIGSSDLWVFWDTHTARWRACSANAWLMWFSVRATHPLLQDNEMSSAVVRSLTNFCKLSCRFSKQPSCRAALVEWVRSQTMRDMRAAWWRSIHRQNHLDGSLSAYVRVNTMMLSLGMHFEQFAEAFALQ